MEITVRQMNGLRDLLSLNSSQVKVVVVETPINPSIYLSKRKVRNLYPQFKNMLVFLTAQANADLWFTQTTVNIPKDDWRDIVHLNEKGSIYFSSLLGNYLASIFSTDTKN